jgi:NAD(P)-dependent dehydrogenase (short-subunit alcohol dehydrogenase family)
VLVAVLRRAMLLQELADSVTGSAGKLHAIRCDVSKEEDVLHAFSEVKKRLGGVDILINNAGLVHETLLSGTSHLQRLLRLKNDTQSLTARTLSGPVARVPVYRYRGPGCDSRLFRIFFYEVVGLERGPLSLARISDVLFERKVAASV